MKITKEIKEMALAAVTAIETLDDCQSLKVTKWEYIRDDEGRLIKIRIEVTDTIDGSDKTWFEMEI